MTNPEYEYETDNEKPIEKEVLRGAPPSSIREKDIPKTRERQSKSELENDLRLDFRIDFEFDLYF